jgi:hypothetical protein
MTEHVGGNRENRTYEPGSGVQPAVGRFDTVPAGIYSGAADQARAAVLTRHSAPNIPLADGLMWVLAIDSIDQRYPSGRRGLLDGCWNCYWQVRPVAGVEALRRTLARQEES